MKTHTIEPWHAFTHASGNTSIYNATGKFTICNCVSTKEDAERAAACVNACEGIPDPETTIPALVKAVNRMLNYGFIDINGQWIFQKEDIEAVRNLLP